MMKRILHQLVQSIDIDTAIKSSYVDFHVKGVSYMNLLRDERLTAKVYFFKPGQQHNDFGWLVWPHNHAYDFDTMVVHGAIQEHQFVEKNSKFDSINFELYDYYSALNDGGNCTLQKMYNCNVEEVSSKIYYPYQTYFNHSSNVHTLSIPSDQLTVLFLLQYADKNKSEPTTMYVPSGLPIPTCDTGLYNSYNRLDFVRDLNLLKQLIHENEHVSAK